MMNDHVSTIMTRSLITVKPEDSLVETKKIFTRKRIHHLPVVDDNEKLVGLVTTRDLLFLNKPFEEYQNLLVREVMKSKLATLAPTEKIATAAEVFLENLFHAVPIVEDGRLVGIVTSFDVMKYNFKKAYPRHFMFQE